MRTSEKQKLLLNHIDTWHNESLIDSETHQRLKDHTIGNIAQSSNNALIIFSVFGALLIGIGIITILAFNWSELNRSTRAIISFIPLSLSVLLTLWAILKEKRFDTASCEGIAAFYVASIGTCLALISQTYHIQTSLHGFFFHWTLLTLPVIYLLRSTFACAAFLIGMATWYFNVSNQLPFTSFTGVDLKVWLMLLSVSPFVFLRHQDYQKTKTGLGYTLLIWLFYGALALSFIISLNTIYLKSDENLLIFYLTVFFVSGYLLSATGIYRSRSLHNDPFRVAGALAVFVISLIFTYTDLDIGGSYGSIKLVNFSGGVSIILLLGWGFLGFKILKEIRPFSILKIIYFIFPLLIFIVGLSWHQPWLFNLLVLSFGVFSIFEGTKENNMSRINWGLGMISILLMLRLFDSSIGLIAKGTVFIIIGVGFILLNLIISRKLKASNLSQKG